MHKTIIFLIAKTKDEFKVPPLFNEITHITIHDQWEIIDENRLAFQNEIIDFDYMITNQIQVGTILKLDIQDKKIITNYFLQTRLENIYVFGEATNCTAPLIEQFQRIYEDISTK